MGSSSGDSLKKVHLQQMLGLIDRQIQMLRSSAELRRTKQPEGGGDFKSTGKIENPLEEGAVLVNIDRIGVVSYNILSSELFPGDHYRKLDGTVNDINPDHRKQIINEKIKVWIQSRKIICLQEVTDDFMSAFRNSELGTILSNEKYNAYFSHYNYNLGKKRDMLGLATLVPNSLFTVQANDLLLPWENHEMKVAEKKIIKENQVNINRMTHDMNELSRLNRERDAQPKTQQLFDSLVSKYQVADAQPAIANSGTMCAYLRKEISAFVNKNKTILDPYKQMRPPSIRDRTVIILHLKDSSNRDLVIANVHLPCNYENPIEMSTLAFRAKEHIIKWLKDKTLDSSPLVLCGDFNSDPSSVTGKAYHCFDGTLSYDQTNVNTECISEDDFREYVVNEKWCDCFAGTATRCVTNYGFTKRSMERCIGEEMEKKVLKNLSMFTNFILSDKEAEESEFDTIFEHYLAKTPLVGAYTKDTLKESIKNEIKQMRLQKSIYMKPKPLNLDHIFIRDKSGNLIIGDYVCPPEEDTIKRLDGIPIPNLAKFEPSDHLFISVSLRFKDT